MTGFGLSKVNLWVSAFDFKDKTAEVPNKRNNTKYIVRSIHLSYAIQGEDRCQKKAEEIGHFSIPKEHDEILYALGR